jgi:glycosyltransferase involved in cell wall biosynthesis
MKNYVIITPVHNEEKYIEMYIDSVINQVKKPKLLLLVDDSSTDSSRKLIENYVNKYRWIKYVYHEAPPTKKQGGKIVNVFNYGLQHIQMEEYDLICKIDSDLELSKKYFEIICKEFDLNEKLGVFGGTIFEVSNGQWNPIKMSEYEVRGAIKTYRVACLKDIGGLDPVLGWDGLDLMKALYQGWDVGNCTAKVKHYRPANDDYNAIYMAYKSGVANYQCGGGVFLAFVRSTVRLVKKPYVLIGFSFLCGYMLSLLINKKRYTSRGLATFINKFHIKRLLSFKR